MVQQTDLKRFRELLEIAHFKNGKEFKTDEIRIQNNSISIWDLESESWYYLTKNLDWTRDEQDEDIFSFM